MNVDSAYELIKICLWEGLFISAPLIVGAMVIGLTVSILQTITTIQEATLTFVPKLLVAVFGTWLLAPWMLERLMLLTASFIQRAGEMAR